jgi:hypothetical protein
MDSEDRNEAQARRREETLARRVGEALDQLSPRTLGECPDAEVLAAYHERSLEPQETARWESHFASCVRCRKILLVLAASSGGPLEEKEVVHLGEKIAAQEKQLGVRPEGLAPGRLDWRLRFLAPVLGKVLPSIAKKAGKPVTDAEAKQVEQMLSSGSKTPPPIAPAHRGWRGRWLVPAFSIALVVAVWFAFRPPWRTTNQSASRTLVAQAPRGEAPLATLPEDLDRRTGAIARQVQKAPGAATPNPSDLQSRPLDSLAQAPVTRGADARNTLSRVAPNSRATNETRRKEDQTVASSGNPESVPPKSPAPPPNKQKSVTEPAASPPAAANAGSLGLDQRAPQSTADAAKAGNAPARDKQSAPAGTGAALEAQVSSGVQAEKKASLSPPSNRPNYAARLVPGPEIEASRLLKAPSGPVLWRVGKGGTIERSGDLGMTWGIQESPSKEDWLGGAAASQTVCWLAGRHGAIALTRDGLHWESVPSPAQAAATNGKMPDWTSITARDAQSATITASDGRRFSTSDGGKTWQAVLPGSQPQ